MANQHHVVDKEGQLAANRVEDTINQMDSEQKDEILSNFDSFRTYLGKRIDLAQSIGLNEEQLAVTAEKIASYLAKHEEPRNREEKLLQELWKAGDKEQQHTLAHLLVRLAQSSH